MALIYRTQSLAEVWADTGLPWDIQLAVNQAQAAGGGTVYIPSSLSQPDGKWRWNGETVNVPVGGVKIFGASPAGCKGHKNNWEAYTATTILHNIQTPNPMFSIGHGTHGTTPPNGGANYPARVSGIQFEADAPTDPTAENTGGGNAINILQIPDFRVDHCTFLNFASIAVFVDANDGWRPSNVSCYGVIDHCVVDNPYKRNGTGWAWGYGFYARGCIAYDSLSQWDNDASHFFGQYGWKAGYTIMYVEDCHFSWTRHATDGIMGGYYCSRFTLYDHPAVIYASAMANLHGSTYVSGRGNEVYSNTFIGFPVSESSMYPWVDLNDQAYCLRGGCGLFYNNNFANNVGNTGEYAGLVVLSDYELSTAYPFLNPHIIYIWNNTMTGGGATISNPAGCVLDVDYFLRAPNQAQDGFTYTPYPYPHPLTLEEGPTTPFLGQLEEGVYVVSVPSTVTVTPDTYNFKQWADGDTNPTKTINLTSDISLTAIYEKAIGLTTLRGIVKDNKGNPIVDADVKCNGVSTKTLADGSYEFKDLENRQYTITISKAGYQSITMQVDASNGGTINLPETMLSPTPIISSWIIPAAVLSLLAVVTVVAVRKKGG